ncbi:hypothetical protein B0H10DRAFT_1927230 [Mycena sp. CBHHK59/15]|nr:hypothetical protein B0H10DRAFT_1927230 [Mycena sp. CBHHK59/15]
MNEDLGARQGNKHTIPNFDNDIQTLMASLQEHEVYVKKEGRVLDDDEMPAPDVLSAGAAALSHGTPSNPLQDFNAQFDQLRRRRDLLPVSALTQYLPGATSGTPQSSSTLTTSEAIASAGSPIPDVVPDSEGIILLDGDYLTVDHQDDLPELVSPHATPPGSEGEGEDDMNNDEDLFAESPTLTRLDSADVIPVTTEDDPDSKHDWRSTGVLRDVLIAPGRLVLPVDPTLSTRVVGKPHYLFESSVLRGFGAQLLQEVTLDLNKKIPKFMPTSNFPYRESAGYACFVCEGDSEIEGLQESDSHLCLKCTPPVALDVTRPQTVLTHMGAHILHDSTIARDDQPCGLCCRAFPMCHFVLKKTGDRVSVNLNASHSCPNFVKRFNYGSAEKSSKKLPCSNVPLRCPECDSKAPAVWCYNLKYHLMRTHPGVSSGRYKHLWELDRSEVDSMCTVWQKTKDQPNKKKTAKKVRPTLKISTAHSSSLALISEAPEPSPHSDSDSDSPFIHDSPIASPRPSQHSNSDYEPPVSPDVPRRSPSPLEYFSDSEFPVNPSSTGPADMDLDEKVSTDPCGWCRQ